MSHRNIILLFDIEKLIYSRNTNSYPGSFFQYVKELLWENQELDYNAITNAYRLTLSTMAILTANPKDKHSGSPELSVIAAHKVAGKILVVLYWNNSETYNHKIDQQIQTKLRRLDAPENFIVSFHGHTREVILQDCFEIFGWSPYETSLIDFQNGGQMSIPETITLEAEI